MYVCTVRVYKATLPLLFYSETEKFKTRFLFLKFQNEVRVILTLRDVQK